MTPTRASPGGRRSTPPGTTRPRHAQAAWGAAHSLFDFCYTYNNGYWVIEYAYGEVANEGAAALLTPMLGDGYFYQGSGTYSSTYDRAQRQENWWTLTAGARGITVRVRGRLPVDREFLRHQRDRRMVPVAQHGEHRRHVHRPGPGGRTCCPDLSSAFVTAGRGTRVTGLTSGGVGGPYEPAFTNSWVTASITPDGQPGRLLPAERHHDHLHHVDAGHRVGGVLDRPRHRGQSAAPGPGPTFNSTAKGANSQGDPDWVLVFHT